MKNEATKVLCDLIEIPSFFDKKTNESKVAFYLKELFDAEGIKSELVKVSEGRYNIIAWYGNNPDKTILLTGHIDTVPTYGNDDLLKSHIENGNIYGRGANDMKGPLVAMAYALISAKRSNLDFDGTIMFAGVVDEELASEGTIDLVKKKYHFNKAIVGEPSSLQICLGHRGLEWITFKSHGERIHSGKRSDENNAIENMTSFIEKYKKEMKVLSHPILGKTSFNVGTICGGTQPSTVADYCEMSADFRFLPGQSFKDVKEEIDRVIDLCKKDNPLLDIEYDIYEGSKMRDDYYHEPCLTSELDSLVKASIKTLANYDYSHELSSFSAWTDGGLINTYLGIPTIVLGPGNLKTAHSDDEYIAIKEFSDAIDIYLEICLEYFNS